VSWIEIEVVFDDGTPFTGNCVVDLPSNLRTDGAPDDEGLIRIEGIDPGSCKVSFPDLDGAVWDVA
jgi:predicted component of type VI protein secretion system